MVTPLPLEREKKSRLGHPETGHCDPN